MTTYNKVLVFLLSILSLTACSSGISKRDQEQFIRKEYPLIRHDALWRNNASTCQKLLQNSIGPVDTGTADYLAFWQWWHTLQTEGILNDIMDIISAKDAEQFKPEYREYMRDSIDDLFIDMSDDMIKPYYSNLELLVMQMNKAIRYASIFGDGEGLNYIIQYLYGHCKATTPIPVITGMEYIKKGHNGLPYWRVHFDDGASHNVRVFINDAGARDLERIMLPL